MFRQNLGKRDRFLWVVIGIILIVVAIYKLEGIVWQFTSLFLGILFLISGTLGFSMIYYIIGHSSKGYGIDKITKKDIERAVKEYGLKTEPIVKIKATKKAKKKVVKKKVTKKKTTKKVASKKKATKKVAKKKTTKKTTKKVAKKVAKK